MNNLRPRLTPLDIINRAEHRKTTQGQIEEQQFIAEALRKHSEAEHSRDKRRRLWNSAAWGVGIILVCALALYLILKH